MIIFNINSTDYFIAKANINDKGQTILYHNGKMYVVKPKPNATTLICQRVLQNDLTRNKLGIMRECAILDKWGYR